MSNLKLINMRDVEVEPIYWLWYPFIPYGKVTIKTVQEYVRIPLSQYPTAYHAAKKQSAELFF